MANGLKSYPNAIFEAWNEPVNNGSWNDPITSSYLTYVSTMYNAIRGAGLNKPNLRTMARRMGTKRSWI